MTTRELLTDCGEERASASCQEREVSIYGSKLGMNYMVWCGACKGAPHEEKAKMSQFERFVTEGKEKADELAKAGALLDGGFMAEARAETLYQERAEVYAALQYAGSFHCSVERWKDREEGNETSNGMECGSR